MNDDVRKAEQPIDTTVDRDLVIYQKIFRINPDEPLIEPMMVVELRAKPSDSPLRPTEVIVCYARYHPDGLFKSENTYVGLGAWCYRTFEGAKAALLYNARCRIDAVNGMVEP